MKIKQIEIYEYNELSDEAKQKALSDFNNRDFDYAFLEDDLSEYLKQLLKKNEIKGDAKLYYSLSYSQGDGVCFIGDFEYKGIDFNIEHSGHYYHSNSVNINYDLDDSDDDLRNDLIESIYLEFKEIFENICDKIEKAGYKQIEYEQSEENFKELCEMNEYTFRANGEMENF